MARSVANQESERAARAVGNEKSCLITGASSGVGFAASKLIAQAGYRVTLGCRDVTLGSEAARRICEAVPDAQVGVLGLDMSLRRSIHQAAAQVGQVDALVHGDAHFEFGATRRSLTLEGTEITWATNYLGPALLTELLLPRLLAARGRVVAVATAGLSLWPWLSVDLTDPEFGHRRFSMSRAYNQSKLAHLAWMLDLARRLRSTPVRVHGVRGLAPEAEAAGASGASWPLLAACALMSTLSSSPDEMARTYAWLVTGALPGEETGGYWAGVGRLAPVSRWAAEPTNRERLASYFTPRSTPE